MTRLVWSRAARADLGAIWDHTAARWGPAQAARYLRELDASCRDIAAGTRPSRPIDDIRPGYRKANVRSHVVFLRLDEAGDTVIVRVLHQRMDAASRLDDGD